MSTKDVWNHENKVSVCYWTERNFDTQLTVSVNDVTYGAPGISYLENITLRKDVSPEGVLLEALSLAVEKTGIWEGIIEYSGFGADATISSLRNRPNIKLQKLVNHDLNESYGAIQKYVRNNVVLG